MRKKESMETAEEMVTLRKENEELKEVLSAVQIDLESQTEVCNFLLKSRHLANPFLLKNAGPERSQAEAGDCRGRTQQSQVKK